jgi:DNA modification methylase
MLSLELQDLKDDIDLSLLGFDPDELDALLNPIEETEGLTDEDAVPDVPDEPKTKLGDIYILGNHRLMCGDSTSIDAVEALMDGQKADMVFTDPPYGVSYTGGHNQKKREGIIADTLQGNDLTDLFADALLCATMVTKDHSAFYIWYANGKAVETFASFSKLPLKVRAVLCWYKVKSGLGAFMSQYIPNYEPCIYAYKDGCSPQWFGASDEKTVWELKKEAKNEYHPTQKPIELPERAIKNSSKSGDLVLDLFGGSGSTLIACEKIGRLARVMELDPKYCDVIVKRWEDFTGKKAELVELSELEKE